MKPRISVITPSFNAAKTIDRAIQSVLAQKYSNVQHLIIDGGSTDGTFNIIQKYQHIKWVSERDQGQADAMNKGFELSNGELIVYLNADDEFAPGVFDKVASFYQSSGSSNKFMLVMDLKVREANGMAWTAVPSLKFSDIADPAKMLFPYNPLSYFYHRKLQESVGKFPLDLRYAMDYWFLLRAYKLADMRYESFEAGTFYNFSNKTSDKQRSESECLQVLIAFYKKTLPIVFLLHPNVIRAKRMMGQLKKL
ncbi:MAG TPA: glycosyltransferase family 2 protein [Chitinophagaceae bacterium]|nr:glycosyltransferase family 2 protein [Chitinophagaceae bacterium]